MAKPLTYEQTWAMCAKGRVLPTVMIFNFTDKHGVSVNYPVVSLKRRSWTKEDEAIMITYRLRTGTTTQFALGENHFNEFSQFMLYAGKEDRGRGN